MNNCGVADFADEAAVFVIVEKAHDVQLPVNIHHTGGISLAAIEEVFELRPHFEWRGLGFIPHSGLRLNAAHAQFDAERRFAVPGVRIADPKACQCGEVLKGAIRPWECKVFGTACTPQTPIGTCMVSSEGACAAFYNYGRHSQRRGSIPVSAM